MGDPLLNSAFPATTRKTHMWGTTRKRGSSGDHRCEHTGGTCSLKEASYSAGLAHRGLETIGRSRRKVRGTIRLDDYPTVAASYVWNMRRFRSGCRPCRS